MLPPERIVKRALEAGIEILLASETKFRAIYDGYPDAEVDALWERFGAAVTRPAIRLGYHKAGLQIPCFYVTLRGADVLSEPLSLTGMMDAATQTQTLFSTESEHPQVTVIGRTPDEVMDLDRLCKACLRFAQQWIIEHDGVTGFYYSGKAELGYAAFGPEVAPEFVYTRALLWTLTTEDNYGVDAPLDGNYVEALLIHRDEYFSTVEGEGEEDDEEVEGGMTSSRDDDE